MKAGFFFQHPVSLDLLKDISNRNSLEFIGVYFADGTSDCYNKSHLYESADELLVQIQIAFIFLDSNSYIELATNALKRGINVFLGDLPSYSYSSLLELNELSFEIGVPIGFGCSGEVLINPNEVVGNYFIMQLIRDAGSEVNDTSFRRMLIYDIASFVRIKPSGMRKIRVDSLPLYNKNPKAINLRMEYDNSSIITASITRVDEPKRCVLRFFTGETGYFKELSTNNVIYDNVCNKTPSILLKDPAYLLNLEKYIHELQHKSNLSFGIDKAIETLSIVESIDNRLYPIN